MMRTVFIINPAAGKHSPLDTVWPSVRGFLETNHISYERMITSHAGDAAALVRTLGHTGEPLRAYGFGGDGTLHELALGAAGLPNVEVGIFPCGSGNDYVRSFGSTEAFLSPERQLSAQGLSVDLIRSGEDCAIGLACMGLDAKVAFQMNRFKHWPLVTGPMAYQMALLKALCGRIGNELEVVIDGTIRLSGNFVFALAGSGQYYGGGFRGAPKAIPNDGLLDFVLIRTPKLHQIPSLVGIYKKGEHVCSPRFEGLLEYRQGRCMEIRAAKPAIATFDGECKQVSRLAFSVEPGAVRFLVPAGCKPQAEPV